MIERKLEKAREWMKKREQKNKRFYIPREQKNLIRNEKIIALRQKRLSYNQIRSFFPNLSRARIHQICSGYQSINTSKIKEKIFQRDNFTCPICENKLPAKNLVIHHFDCDDRNNEEKNLFTLCRRCHTKIHRDHNFLGKPLLLKTAKVKFKYWSTKHKIMECKDCKSNKRKHKANGLCGLCFQRKYTLLQKHKLIS